MSDQIVCDVIVYWTEGDPNSFLVETFPCVALPIMLPNGWVHLDRGAGFSELVPPTVRKIQVREVRVIVPDSPAELGEGE